MSATNSDLVNAARRDGLTDSLAIADALFIEFFLEFVAEFRALDVGVAGVFLGNFDFQILFAVFDGQQNAAVFAFDADDFGFDFIAR